MAGVEAFIFAHPDDEFGVFAAIELAVARGSEVVCVYLTDGAFGGQSSSRRERESLSVLNRLGVRPEGVHFIGRENGFRDGQLSLSLESALNAVSAILDERPLLTAIHLHAWEGGHQDHDAAHLIGAVYAARRNLLAVCRQFALYRDGAGPMKIAICSPILSNGVVESFEISWIDRIRYLLLCFSYRSQWKTFSVLLPMLAMYYIRGGAHQSQRVLMSRLYERPHPGLLSYERWRRARYGEFRQVADDFIASNAPSRT